MMNIFKGFPFFLIMIAVMSGCTLTSSNHDALASALGESLACVDLTRIEGQICSIVTSQPIFPSDDIQVYYVSQNTAELQLVISQSDFGSMYSDVQLFSNDKWLAYGILEEGQLIYKIYQLDELIRVGTFAEPEYSVAEYGLIDIIDITEQGHILFDIDFDMKRPTLKCIENSPDERCYIEDKIIDSTEIER